MGAHEQILTTLQRLFTKAGYRTERKHVPHSRGLKKKADLWIKDFQLEGIRNVIIDLTLRPEFHGSCANLTNNGEPSHPDVNGNRVVLAPAEKMTDPQNPIGRTRTFGARLPLSQRDEDRLRRSRVLVGFKVLGLHDGRAKLAQYGWSVDFNPCTLIEHDAKDGYVNASACC